MRTRPGGQDCGGERRPHGGAWSKSRCQREREQLETLTKHAADAMFWVGRHFNVSIKKRGSSRFQTVQKPKRLAASPCSDPRHVQFSKLTYGDREVAAHGGMRKGSPLSPLSRTTPQSTTSAAAAAAVSDGERLRAKTTVTITSSSLRAICSHSLRTRCRPPTGPRCASEQKKSDWLEQRQEQEQEPTYACWRMAS